MSNEKYKFEDYTIIFTPLSEEDGGGYYVTFRDLKGCHADGETIEEAAEEARDVFKAWMDAEMEYKGKVPPPTVKIYE